ncbi:MAG: alpha-glucosidase [Sarcina sp.]
MKKIWWKEAVAYQIYPKSFKDSNGDGIGDLKGIIEKLDYLKNLGIDVLWICPFYKSPNDDNGYDISDYKAIAKEYGTMEDLDLLLKELHSRGMKLILDLVINHSSDEHPWFIESRSSKGSSKRDWYIWKDGKDSEEPNNWESIFKGSAWEYDENTKQYYLHLFTKKQPDLNWENEELRKELYSTVNWWLDKGIDGFRVDAISHIKKEPGFEDMPNPEGLKYVSSFDKHMNIDGIQDFLKELKEETFDKYDIMTVGEANGVNAKDAKEWVSEEDGKFNMVFQFEHLNIWDYGKENSFSIKTYKEVLTRWQNGLDKDGWNALFIENHDIPRVVSTWGNDSIYWMEAAKAFATIYFMQKGTAFIYQGQEIGMKNVQFKSVDDYDDVKGINIYKERIAEGISEKEAMKELWAVSRDNARTPMQWDSSENAGFTIGKSWIAVNENYKEINVEKQLEDENSIFNFYKNLIKLKKSSETLIYGEYSLIENTVDNIFAYRRTLNGESYLVLANLGIEEEIFKFEKTLTNENLIMSNYDLKDYEIRGEVKLKPYESRVYKFKI